MTGDQSLCQEIVDTALALSPKGLGVGRSGNVSARCADGMLITPSGVPYETMSVDDIVQVNEAGNVPENSLEPSSEWRFHQAIYQSRPEAGAVVHCHSRFATVLACARTPIPAFHYMVAVAGGADIACADYAVFGSEDLSRSVISALNGRSACLMANHGQVAFGNTLAAAFELACEVEELSAQYCEALKLNRVHLLSTVEMDAVLERFKSYGRNA